VASQRISVRVSRGIVRRLKERSKATGARESQVVRDALEQYLSRKRTEQTTYDLLQGAGLIGCVRGVPRDLSTNKKYLKGFGESK
jgi:metal-responsive CopG/Arc/MetJ family transcriptional regulator